MQKIFPFELGEVNNGVLELWKNQFQYLAASEAETARNSSTFFYDVDSCVCAWWSCWNLSHRLLASEQYSLLVAQLLS